MGIIKKPAKRKVLLTRGFINKVRKHIATYDTMEDAATAMGFKRWQTLGELLNRGTCHQATLDKINAALEAAEKTPATT